MQATITYLLTEQAQRAQMMATGQPVTRKQTTIEDIPAELLTSPYAKIDEAGNLAFDLTRTVGLNHDGSVSNSGNGCAAIYGVLEAIPESGLAALQQLISTVAAKSRKLQTEWQAQIAREKAAAENKSAELAAKKLAAQQLLADFVADPAARAIQIDSGTPYWIKLPGDVTLSRDLMGLDAISAVAKIARERGKQDADAKAAKAAAKEQAKLDYLRIWIAEHGTPSQIARSAEGLLCRDEAIGALSESTFAPLDGFLRYTNDSRPSPDCDREECDGEDCPVIHTVVDTVDCLCELPYATYAAIRAAMPGTTYVLRTHTAQHDCDHEGSCACDSNYSCMVKVTVGPFILQREYAL